jgi:hypothetical protein
VSVAGNARLAAARKFAVDIVEDPKYRETLKSRALGGILSPQVEVRLLEYAYGKPIDMVEAVNPDSDLDSLSLTELHGLLTETQDALLRMMKDDEGRTHEPQIHH